MTDDSLQPLFERLGLSPDASVAAVRKAFRREAMRLHPDRNPSPEAAEAFVQVRAAYEALLSHLSMLEGSPEGTGRASGDTSPQPASQQDELWIDLEVAITGGQARHEVMHQADCPECDASGWTELSYSRACRQCSGSGRMRTAQGLSRCSACDGGGYVRRLPCTQCAGEGCITTTRALAVSVPPLCIEGRRLRLRGQGADGVDLLLEVRYREHPRWRRQDNDLTTQVPVSVLTLIAGGSVVLPLPEGPREWTFDSEQWRTPTLTIEEAGLPMAPADGSGIMRRGRLILQLTPAWPTNLDEDLLKRVRRLDKKLQKNFALHFAAAPSE